MKCACASDVAVAPPPAAGEKGPGVTQADDAATTPPAVTSPVALRQMQRVEHDSDMLAEAEARNTQRMHLTAQQSNKAAVLLNSAEQRIRRSRLGVTSPSAGKRNVTSLRALRRRSPSQQQDESDKVGVWYKDRIVARCKVAKASKSPANLSLALLPTGATACTQSGEVSTTFTAGVSAGSDHIVLALQSPSGGSGVFCVGGLGIGQDDPTELIGCPMPLMRTARVATVSAGHRHTAFLLATGEMLTAGMGEHGRLGHGDTAPRNNPEKLAALTGKVITDISAGGAHTAAVLDSGKLLLWGKGSKGQQGSARYQDQLIPAIVHVTNAHLPAVRVACGESHTLVISATGRVFSRGHKAPASPHFVAVDFPFCDSATARVVDVAAGGSHAVAVCVDGAAFAWGANASGQLGQGDFDPREAPVQLHLKGVPKGKMMLDPASCARIVGAACGAEHTLVLSAAGHVFSCGAGAGGCLGQGDEAASPSLQAVRLGTGRTSFAPVLIAAGGAQSAVTMDDGKLFVWGQRHGAAAQLEPRSVPLAPWTRDEPAALARIDAALRSAKERVWSERLGSFARSVDLTSSSVRCVHVD